MLVIEEGEGIYLTDAQGRRYIDAISGIWVVAVGHGRTELADVAREQMQRLAYANTFTYASRPAVDLATKLATLTPPSINKALFVNSGSDAVEAAIRMAKPVPLQPRRQGASTRLSRASARTTASAWGRCRSTARTTSTARRSSRSSLATCPCRASTAPAAPSRRPIPSATSSAPARSRRRFSSTARRPSPAFIAEPISTANGNWVPQEEYWTHRARALRQVQHRAHRRRGDQRLRPHRRVVRDPALPH